MQIGLRRPAQGIDVAIGVVDAGAAAMAAVAEEVAATRVDLPVFVVVPDLGEVAVAPFSEIITYDAFENGLGLNVPKVGIMQFKTGDPYLGEVFLKMIQGPPKEELSAATTPLRWARPWRWINSTCPSTWCGWTRMRTSTRPLLRLPVTRTAWCLHYLRD